MGWFNVDEGQWDEGQWDEGLWDEGQWDEGQLDGLCWSGGDLEKSLRTKCLIRTLKKKVILHEL